MGKTRELSPAMQLLDLVWENEGYSMGHSWDRLNQAMSRALSLAICYDFRFDLKDFGEIATKHRFGYWGGNDRHMLGEGFYAAACGDTYGENRSACRSFEKWKQRKPFIFDGHRIAIGKEFQWHSRRLWCTSFSEDGQYLTACSYVTDKGEEGAGRWSGSKVYHRYRIAQSDLQEERKRLKAFAHLSGRLRIGEETTGKQREVPKAKFGTFRKWRDKQFRKVPHDADLNVKQLQKLEAKLDELLGVKGESDAPAS